MKRQEVESRFQALLQNARTRIERDPLKSFGVGVLIGIILAEFHELIIPLVILLAIVAAALYFFSDSEPFGPETPRNPEVRPDPTVKPAEGKPAEAGPTSARPAGEGPH